MKSPKHDSGGTKLLALCCALLFVSGCAVHYYDKKTGTEHLWGFGHMKMKTNPPNEGMQAIVKGTETLGFSMGTFDDGGHIAAGWNYQRRIVIGSNAAVRLEWPNGSFFNVRVGTLPPWETNSPPATNSNNP